jgi:hypothetical protein
MSLDLARDLDSALAQYANVPGLAEHVRSACGADPGANIHEQRVVYAYVLRMTDIVFSTYVITDTGFVLAEMATNGDTLSVWVPLDRIRRVVETRIGENVTLTVEIDADVARVVLESEETGGARGDDEGYIARSQARGNIIPAMYEITGDVNDTNLVWFGRVLRHSAV